MLREISLAILRYFLIFFVLLVVPQSWCSEGLGTKGKEQFSEAIQSFSRPSTTWKGQTLNYPKLLAVKLLWKTSKNIQAKSVAFIPSISAKKSPLRWGWLRSWGLGAGHSIQPAFKNRKNTGTWPMVGMKIVSLSCGPVCPGLHGPIPDEVNPHEFTNWWNSGETSIWRAHTFVCQSFVTRSCRKLSELQSAEM